MAKNRWLDVQIRQNIEARHEQLVAVHTRSPKQAIVSEAAHEKFLPVVLINSVKIYEER